MKRKQRKKLSPFEAELLRAERRGMRVLPPGEHEPTRTEAKSERLVEKYGSLDDLPLAYAQRALLVLKLKEVAEFPALALAFVKDEVGWLLSKKKKPEERYRRLRIARDAASLESYSVFYRALVSRAPNIPRPAEKGVIKLVPNQERKEAQ